jgi:hypothetical protein
MLTPEEVETNKRIAAIFTPYAVEQAEAYFKQQSEPTHVKFVHYSSAYAALKIIEQKRIWMRNVTCMSDFSEVRHGYRILHGIFSDQNVRDAFKEALDLCEPNIAEESFKIFDSWWNDISLNTYITSISEHPDNENAHGRLSMWRAFGGTNTPRVALVFKAPHSVLNAGVLNLIFSPVAYLSEPEVRAQVTRVVENIRANVGFLKSLGRARVVACVFNMLVAGVTCLKHESFREEKEWRLIYAPKRWASPLIDFVTETVAGVPQVIYRIPFDAKASDAGLLDQFDLAKIFDRLIIGPSVYPYSMVEAFRLALEKAEVTGSDKRIVLSSIPLRM